MKQEAAEVQARMEREIADLKEEAAREKSTYIEKVNALQAHKARA